MKKDNVIIGIMILTFAFVFAACGQQTQISITEEVVVSSEPSVSVEASKIEETTQESAETSLKDWGYVHDCYVFNNKNEYRFVEINFPPHCVGNDEGTGIIGTRQVGDMDKDILAVWDRQLGPESPVVEGGVENVLEAYSESLNFIMECFRKDSYGDFVFEIRDKNLVTINDFEMCKYVGTHTFTNDGQAYKRAFVGYSTVLSHGGYTYWLVIDETEDQSMAEYIDEAATNMALTLREVY